MEIEAVFREQVTQPELVVETTGNREVISLFKGSGQQLIHAKGQ